MRYFITGATGFIGGVLARQLREAGHEVVALVRDAGRAQSLRSLGVVLAQGDITDRAGLRTPMEGADGVFHVAGWYRVGGSTRPAFPINVEGTRNVLETMRDLGIPKGVYTSTLATFSDTQGQVRDESYVHRGRHVSVYDETKWRAHHEVAAPLIEQGLPLVVVMPGIVYGPDDPSQMGRLLRDAHAGKPVLVPKRTAACWAHVEDVAHAHVLAMQKGQPGEAYIVSGPCHTWHEAFALAAKVGGGRLRALVLPPALLRAASKLMGFVEKVLPVPDDYTAEPLRVAAGVTYLGTNAKARHALGYDPRDLEAGLRDTFSAR